MGRLIYITGLSGSGKTTIAKDLQSRIPGSILLDGDEIRATVNKDLGYDRESKIQNIKRNNELISLLYNQGFTVICAFMASIPDVRDEVFNKCQNNIKVQLITPLEVCIQRDVKGLYKNKPQDFAGMTSSYNGFSEPDIKIDTSTRDVYSCTQIILDEYDISD